MNLIAYALFTLNHLIMIWVKNYYIFIAMYGVSNGVAIGLGYIPGLYTTCKYFPDNKSVITGMILFCVGMFASVSSPLTTMLVNPDNLSPDSPEVIKRVPLMFAYLSMVYGALTLVGCSLIPHPFKSEIALEKRELKEKLKKITNLDTSDAGSQLEEKLNKEEEEEMRHKLIDPTTLAGHDAEGETELDIRTVTSTFSRRILGGTAESNHS